MGSRNLDMNKKTIVTVALLGMLSANAFAVLGGQPSYLNGNKTQALGGSSAISSKMNGVNVTEYEKNNTVFAVSWSGPIPPDLRTLYGPYFNDFNKAQQASLASGAGHNTPISGGTTVIFDHAGHMGAYSGTAQIPNLTPYGFSFGR